jgi:hypothetical protein
VTRTLNGSKKGNIDEPTVTSAKKTEKAPRITQKNRRILRGGLSFRCSGMSDATSVVVVIRQTCLFTFGTASSRENPFQCGQHKEAIPGSKSRGIPASVLMYCSVVNGDRDIGKAVCDQIISVIQEGGLPPWRRCWDNDPKEE